MLITRKKIMFWVMHRYVELDPIRKWTYIDFFKEKLGIEGLELRVIGFGMNMRFYQIKKNP